MELTNLSREEKKAYDLERIDALVQQQQGLARTAEITALGIDSAIRRGRISQAGEERLLYYQILRWL